MSALELHQPSGSGQHAYLAIPVKGKEPLTVRLNPSWVALLRVLEGEYRKDVARPQAARGWRSYLEVGKQMGNVPDQDPIEATTARAYVYRLRRTIARACRAGRLPNVPELIESRRGNGIRLGIEVLFME